MRKLFLFFTSIVVVCLLSGPVSLRSRQQKPLQTDEVATPVEEDALTTQQKEHSKLYERYERERKIRDALLEKPGGYEAFRTACIFLPGKPMPSIVGELAEAADAILIASFVSKSSQLTTGGTYIFTDYQLRTQEVLKDRGSGNLKADTIITVTRPGGKVLLFGKTASFTELSFKPLLPGHRYLLFLKYLRTTDSYRAVSHEASFDITNATVESLSEAMARPFEREVSAFITSVKVALFTPPKKGVAK